MTKQEATIYADELNRLGLKTEIEDRGDNMIDVERYQLRGHSAFASVLFFDAATARGFVQGVNYTLSNLARPSIK